MTTAEPVVTAPATHGTRFPRPHTGIAESLWHLPVTCVTSTTTREQAMTTFHFMLIAVDSVVCLFLGMLFSSMVM